MKYIDADKLRAEIERRMKEDYNSGDEEIDYVAQGVCAGILSFLDTLEEPVSEDLEEAARHSEMLTYPMPEDGDIEKVMKVQEARIFHDIGFKAGAEWQKNQQPLRFLEIPAGDVAPAEEEGGPWEEDEQ